MSETITSLMDNLLHSSYEVRYKAEEALIELGSEAVPALIEALQGTERKKAVESAKILGQIQDDRKIQHFLKAMTSDDVLLAQVAVHGLAAIRPPLVEEFVTALSGCHLLVWAHIMQALGEFRDKSVIPHLVLRLQQTDDSVQRYTIIEALGKIGDTSVANLIEAYLDDENYHVRDYAKAALELLHASV